jgi:ketosteroid isomerase-like protein
MRSVVALIALTSLPACGAASQAPPAAVAPSPVADERCAVWNREVAFAHSVRDHDAAVFAEHVQAGAVFVSGGDALTRGRDAIVADWTPLIRGEALHLGWYPTSVVVTGDPRVVLSRGPYWIEKLKPDASPRLLTGTFQSVWVKEADGVWRVAIDGGTPPPAPASEADVEKIKAAAPVRCPAAG